MSLRCVPPANGSLRITCCPGEIGVAESIDGGAHRCRHRAEVHGNVLGLHEQFAVGREQRGRAVGPLLDVRAERGAPEHRAHLVGDAGRAGRRAPAAPAGSSTSVIVRSPDRRRTRRREQSQPGRDPDRAVGLRDDGGPDAACALPATRRRQRHRSARASRCEPVARSATTSTGASGHGVAVAALVLVVEVVDTAPR